MPRLLFNDERWSRLKKILLQERIYNKYDLHQMVEGMLYRLRIGCPWRDSPRQFGCWNSVCKKFNAWSASGKWRTIFNALVVDADIEWVFIDGSYIKAHQHSAGAESESDEGALLHKSNLKAKVSL